VTLALATINFHVHQHLPLLLGCDSCTLGACDALGSFAPLLLPCCSCFSSCGSPTVDTNKTATKTCGECHHTCISSAYRDCLHNHVCAGLLWVGQLLAWWRPSTVQTSQTIWQTGKSCIRSNYSLTTGLPALRLVYRCSHDVCWLAAIVVRPHSC
jgi:hypothetical protein